MGFEDEGIVALSGAHTLGRAFQAREFFLGDMVGWGLFLFVFGKVGWLTWNKGPVETPSNMALFSTRREVAWWKTAMVMQRSGT